jgi:hypothetical protein
MLTRFLDWITGIDIAKLEARARMDAVKAHYEDLDRIRAPQGLIFQKIMELPWPEGDEELTGIELPAADYDTLVRSMNDYAAASGFGGPIGGGILILGAPVTRGERYALTFA